MKTRIEYTTFNENSEPILIEDLKAFKNCVGQWVISFQSANHKYLDEWGTFSGHTFDPDNGGYTTYETGIEFCTSETFVDPDDGTWAYRNSFLSIGPNGGHLGKFRWYNHPNGSGKFYFGNKKVEMPNRTVKICLVPETEQERRELDGTFCVLPLKWTYEIVCVPYEHFWEPRYARNQGEFEVVN